MTTGNEHPPRKDEPTRDAAQVTLPLRNLGLQAGQATSREVAVRIDPYRQAGIEYEPRPEVVPAYVDATAMTSGLSFRLRLHAHMHGVCARCLDDAVLHIVVDSHEVDDPNADDEELRSEFVLGHGDQLDVGAWAQDAVGILFPVRVLCREDCAGLCPVCGTNHNVASCSCTTEQRDSRWDALKALNLESTDSLN